LRDANVLDLTPLRIADWEDHGDRVVVVRPRPAAPWYLLAIEWLRYALAVRRIRLDAVGSAVWRACDGRNAVADIVNQVRGAFGERVEPVEARLGGLIRRLRSEGLLAYREFDPIQGAEGRPVAPVLNHR
jgi:hypothetical protein